MKRETGCKCFRENIYRYFFTVDVKNNNKNYMKILGMFQKEQKFS